MAKPTHPKLICENCGHYNQLRFDPKTDLSRLGSVKCGKCLKNAYWTYYWKEGQMTNVIIFAQLSQMRAILKKGTYQLIYSLNKKYA